ncbi:uncharacterized protein MELLADRAFT_77272 [Melampsora larici-populina 98AG31]|uniref:Uncharacterized protein n=1 Tax=Melampsora larici-populina (strain 98AG31 / pathotype 3-4-7) TaxID=747676 RepID=F4RFM1_MELLP|nr:uncharacterized protein MELLADRAFT_77272 [Melampsora larici-populina 98AG31]EGG08833.1 hypothetical protein MELLADRAFT_77272 [Melampsora larici-populina 98AG31]
MPLPPMEWIKLKTTGSSSPPPISHGCLIGPTFTSQSSPVNTPGSGSAYLFGGRSSTGTTTNNLFVLDYTTSISPAWSQPTSSPSNTIFTSTPNPRSHMICGWDAASNYRNQLSVFAGRSSDGTPLNDYWYFDPANSFWAEPISVNPNKPSPLYGAIGGIDPTYVPTAPSTSSALIYMGGSNSTSSASLSPSGLIIDGQLGSNTNTITLTVNDLGGGVGGDPGSNNLVKGRWGMSSTIMSDEFVDSPNPTCALTNGGILNFGSNFSPVTLNTTSTSSWQSFNYCPAPRIGGTMVPNRNTFDSSYSQQVIMIGGRPDLENWNDQGGSNLGEVDVLDLSSGTWSRVIPAQKEGERFTQKEGVMALALGHNVGATSSSNGTTDILVYGGIDVSTGQASNELWVLRLHGGRMTGNGTTLGVQMSYLPSCVTPTPKNSRTSSRNPNHSTDDQSGTGPSSNLNVSEAHTFMTTVALGLILLSVTALRYEDPGLLSFRRMWRMPRLWALLTAWVGVSAGVVVLIFGVIAGFTHTRMSTSSSNSSSNSTSSTPSTRRMRRSFFHDSSPNHVTPLKVLTTSTHSKLGLALMVAGCFAVPCLYIIGWIYGKYEEEYQSRKPQYGERRRLKVKESNQMKDTTSIFDPRYWAEQIRIARLNKTRKIDRRSKRESQIEGIQNGNPTRISQTHQNGMMVGDESMVTSVEKSSCGIGLESPIGSPNEKDIQNLERINDSTHGKNESTSTAQTRIESIPKQEDDHLELQESILPQEIPITPDEIEATVSEHFDASFQGESSARLTPLAINSNVIDMKDNSMTDLSKHSTRPVLRALHNFSNTLLPFNKTKVEKKMKSSTEKETGTQASFEVVNRRSALSKSRLGSSHGERKGFNRRLSLDLSIEIDRDQSRVEAIESHRSNSIERINSSDDDDEHHHHHHHHHHPPGGIAVEDLMNEPVSNRVTEEIVEEEEEEDSIYQKAIKPRKKLRRLGDMFFHTILFLSNVFLIVSYFTMVRSKFKWIGGVYLIGCIGLYFGMGYLAWNGKPSSESTLVIFMSIIKNGRSGSGNPSGPGTGTNGANERDGSNPPAQFSSYAQQQHLPSPSVIGTVAATEVGINAQNLRPRSLASTLMYPFGSDPGDPSHPSHHPFRSYWGNDRLNEEVVQEDEEGREDDEYWNEREVQIVTTAPRRRLAVVNG